MGAKTNIEWTMHTFNIAWGCQKVSAGCTNCYAETLAKRYGFNVWGPGTERRTFGEKHWKEPLTWDRQSRELGEAFKLRRNATVFCSSMCDIFEDHPTIDQERAKLWPLIAATPNLDWQLLTKRADRIGACLPKEWGNGWKNVWLGVSVEDQKTADERIPRLLKAPASIRFVSYEPALGPVNIFSKIICSVCGCTPRDSASDRCALCHDAGPGIDWCIVGGESGQNARPFNVAWAVNVLQQCRGTGCKAFVKQMGSNVIDRNDVRFEADMEVFADGPRKGQPTDPRAWPAGRCGVDVEHNPNGFREEHQGAPVRLHLRDAKGGDMEEWPEVLRVRQFPEVRG